MSLGELVHRGESGLAETLVRGSASKKEISIPAFKLLTPAWLCVGSGLLLSLLGVLAIDLGTDSPAGGLSALAWRQAVFCVVGLLAALVVALPHFRMLSVLAWPAYIASLALLVFLLLPFVPASIVTPRNGTRGWIDLGPVDFQPSEVAKIAYVLVVARYMRWRSSHRRLRGLILPGLIAAPMVGLIVLQPDLGTASLFGPALLGMLIAAGARMRHIALIFAVAALAAPLSYPILRDHQKTRIVGLIRQLQGDTSTASDINFQSYTAQALIGAGGLAGAEDTRARALVRYNRLPERHNDTVFAVAVTRWGLAGGMLLMALYLVWIAGALLTSAITLEPEGRLICVGVAGFVAAQAAVNIGMNLGILPIVGITLPFISYGGSSLLTVWLMTGLIMNVGLHPARPPFRPSFEYDERDGEGTIAAATGRPSGLNIFLINR